MLISKFYTVDIFKSNKQRITPQNSILIKLLLTFIFVVILIYLVNEKNENFVSKKLDSLNKIFIKNGFVIKNVEIIGASYVHKEDIYHIIKKHENQNIFNLDLSEIHKDIRNINWIKDVSIKIIYPSTIKILLIEKVPVAIWQNKDGNNLIENNGGIILEKNIHNINKNFLIIKGKGANKNFNPILQILNTNKDFSKNIWSLNYVSQRRWDVHFKQGLIVRLPSSNVFEAWQKIINLHKNFNILELGLTEMDLRNNNQILGKIDIDKKLIFKEKKS